MLAGPGLCGVPFKVARSCEWEQVARQGEATGGTAATLALVREDEERGVATWWLHIKSDFLCFFHYFFI